MTLTMTLLFLKEIHYIRSRNAHSVT